MFSGHIGFLINGSDTWAFMILALIALSVAEFNIREEMRIIEKQHQFDGAYDTGSCALASGGIGSFGVVAVPFGLFVDQNMPWAMGIFLLLMCVAAYPLMINANSRLLNTVFPHGGLEPHEH